MIFHINDAEQWRPILQDIRDAGQAIVTTNGTFDIVHSGHIHLLREAKAQGDFLVLGLNSDASVKAYKSPKRPIVPQDERAALLAAVRYVDMILLFDEPESLRFVKDVRPDVHVKDSTYGYDLIEAPIVEEYGGKIHLVIKKVIELYKDDPGCL